MAEIKRKYERPSMTVFELKQQPQLLQTSGGPNGGPFPSWFPEDI